MYGMTQYKPQKYYFADIRSLSGGARWTYVRTNLGRKVAYSMIAKESTGDQIESFRDELEATNFDRKALAQVLAEI
jgi:hypothetical protein